MAKLYVCFTFLVFVLIAAPSSYANPDWLVLRNAEYKVRLLYPPAWTVVTADTPYSIAAVASPRSGSMGICSVGITRTPQTASQTQKSLNEAMASKTMTSSDWLREFGTIFPEAQVIETMKTKIQNQPAHSANIETSYENLGEKTYMRLIVITTLTPGLVWNFGCGTSAQSIHNSRQSFAYWESTFYEILRSVFIEQ